MTSTTELSDYGLYLTHNIYDGFWYCFSREDATAYWIGEDCTKAKGKTPQQALSNYKNGTTETDGNKAES